MLRRDTRNVTSDQGIDREVAHDLELTEATDVVVISAWCDLLIAASAQLVKALQVASSQGTLIVGLC